VRARRHTGGHARERRRKRVEPSLGSGLERKLERRRTLARHGLDLDALAREEAADAADDALALGQDDGVRPERRTDLRQHVVERCAAECPRRAHAATTGPTASTRMPGTI